MEESYAMEESWSQVSTERSLLRCRKDVDVNVIQDLPLQDAVAEDKCP